MGASHPAALLYFFSNYTFFQNIIREQLEVGLLLEIRCILFLIVRWASFFPELQQLVQSLERRERHLIRQNFDIEASYYQLKSKYVMVLNHIKSSSKQSIGIDCCLDLEISWILIFSFLKYNFMLFVLF